MKDFRQAHHQHKFEAAAQRQSEKDRSQQPPDNGMTFTRELQANQGSVQMMEEEEMLQAKFSAQLMEEEELSIYGGAAAYIESQVNYHSSDWYHYYLQFDVTPYLQSLSIPVLALNGDLDDAVEAAQNLNGIKRTLEKAGNTNFKTVKLKNISHFFQKSKDNSIERVYFNKESFSRKALREIGKWILSLEER